MLLINPDQLLRSYSLASVGDPGFVSPVLFAVGGWMSGVGRRLEAGARWMWCRDCRGNWVRPCDPACHGELCRRFSPINFYDRTRYLSAWRSPGFASPVLFTFDGWMFRVARGVEVEARWRGAGDCWEELDRNSLDGISILRRSIVTYRTYTLANTMTLYSYLLMNTQEEPMKPFKIIVEKHLDGYVAYPIGMRGVVVGEGDTYDEAITDVTSAIKFHIETFGKDAFSDDEIIDTRIAEVVV